MMSGRQKAVLALFAIGALSLVILWIAGFFTAKIDSSLSPASQYPPDAPDPYLVEQHTIMAYEAIPASTVARDATMVSSRILAVIDQIHVRAGDNVTRGQLLIELDDEALLARETQAHERVQNAAASVEDAELTLTRISELLSRQLAAQAEIDQARTHRDAQVAQLEQAQAASREASVIRSYSRITAPISGRIIERLAEPGDTTAPAVPLLSLYDPLSIRVEAYVPETLALGLTIGQEIDVQLDAMNTRVPGVIEEIVPAADIASRSFLVKSSIDYQTGLMPGMFARFILPVGSRDTLLIPPAYVTQVGQLELVYVLGSERTVQRRYVRTGSQQQTLIEVLSGVEAGEFLIAPQNVN